MSFKMCIIGLRKNKGSRLILPFILGLILGLLISYGIRALSKSSLCRQNILITLPPTTNAQVPTPDQVVNLASNQENALFDVSDGDNKSSVSTRCRTTNCSAGDPAGTKGDVNSKKPRKLLFVGVMTASVFLETRAKAVWETWGKEIPGKVVFFTGGNTYNEERRKSFNETFTLVPLPGVDDSYPPQKKSFMMLKYMFDNYGDDYEWFMRADDDVYVRADKLADFLRLIDSRHLLYLGQAGKGNIVEKGTLNLAHNENFCMGGPGIILSRPTLKKLAPNVQQCLKDMYSTHEDVEVGRCVQKYARVSCTWAYEMQSVFHHNSSGDVAFTGKLKRREVHKSITLHPIKYFKHLYRLHVYFMGLKIQEMLYEKIEFHRDILMSQFLQSNQTLKYHQLLKDVDPVESTDSIDKYSMDDFTLTGLSPSLNKYSPTDLDDILPWNFMGKGIFSTEIISPKSKLKSDGKEALEDVVREVMDTFNSYSRARGRVVDFKEILYGYQRINPLHGVDYILDLFMTYRKYRGRKLTLPVRRHIYVQRPFSPLQMRLISSNSENQTFNQNIKTKMVMIVPLAGRYETFQRFLDNFSATCIELFSKSHTSETKPSQSNGSNIRFTSFVLSLVVVLFGSDKEKEKFLHLVEMKRDSLWTGNRNEDNGREPLCKIKMVQIDTEFSRGIALETGISQCTDEDLLFLIDVDLTFTADVVRRVNLNTRRGHQAYFPVVFSQYNPKFYSVPKNNNANSSVSNNFGSKNQTLQCQLDSDFGYWREFGFGIGAFYKSDFRHAGGFDTTIKGWGKEDVALFDRFLLHTNLTIFRAPDPHLIHLFHETECDRKLPKAQLDMCLGSHANTMGSEHNLMKYILKHQKQHIGLWSR